MDRKKISQPFLQAWQEATTLRNTLNYFKAFRLNLLEWIKLFPSTPFFPLCMCMCVNRSQNVICEATYIPRQRICHLSQTLRLWNKTFSCYLPNNTLPFLWLLFLWSFLLIISSFRKGNVTPTAVWTGIPAQSDLANSQAFYDDKLQF